MGNVNYLLVVVALALLIGVIKGYRRGFLRLLVYIFGLIAVIFIVTKLSPYVSDFVINNTSAYEDVRGKIISLYDDKNSELEDVSVEDEQQVIESFGLPDLIAGALVSNNNSQMYKTLAATLFKEYISGYLAKLVIKASSFVGLFVVLWIAEFILLAAVKIIEKIPVLKTLNRLMGVGAGIFMALVIIWVVFIGIMMFFGNSLGVKLLAMVQDSMLLKFLFNNNPLFKVIL